MTSRFIDSCSPQIQLKLGEHFDFTFSQSFPSGSPKVSNSKSILLLSVLLADGVDQRQAAMFVGMSTDDLEPSLDFLVQYLQLV